jgi:hypothetical protein
MAGLWLGVLWRRRSPSAPASAAPESGQRSRDCGADTDGNTIAPAAFGGFDLFLCGLFSRFSLLWWSRFGLLFRYGRLLDLDLDRGAVDFDLYRFLGDNRMIQEKCPENELENRVFCHAVELPG